MLADVSTINNGTMGRTKVKADSAEYLRLKLQKVHSKVMKDSKRFSFSPDYILMKTQT